MKFTFIFLLYKFFTIEPLRNIHNYYLHINVI